MAGNTTLKGTGISYAPTEKQMAAYDALPPTIREALANAAFSWAPYPIYQRFRRGGLRAHVYAKVIPQWDRNQIAKDRKRVWGISGRTKRSK